MILQFWWFCAVCLIFLECVGSQNHSDKQSNIRSDLRLKLGELCQNIDMDIHIDIDIYMDTIMNMHMNMDIHMNMDMHMDIDMHMMHNIHTSGYSDYAAIHDQGTGTSGKPSHPDGRFKLVAIALLHLQVDHSSFVFDKGIPKSNTTIQRGERVLCTCPGHLLLKPWL